MNERRLTPAEKALRQLIRERARKTTLGRPRDEYLKLVKEYYEQCGVLKPKE